MTPAEVMRCAADLLEDDAEALRQSHTLSGGNWHITEPVDEIAKAQHDERVSIAAKLRVMASL